jgi:predicted DNA-binding WGR domain protein
MRRFEFIEGSSSKFWEVEVAGDALTVRYGRIGTQGQTQTKAYASDAKAQAEHDKLVREKTGKGYAEVGVAGAAALAPVAPKTAGPTVTTPVAVPSPAPTPTPAPAPGASEAQPAAEPQPPGQFLWTPNWRKLLPVWRGTSGAPLPPLVLGDCLADLRRRVAATRQHARRHFDGSFKRLMAQMGVDIDAATVELPATLLASPPDRETWVGLIKQAVVASQVIHSDSDSVTAAQVWQVAVAAHGLPFAVDTFLEGLQAAPRNAVNSWALEHSAGLDELRARIAAAADSDYARLREVASAHAVRGELPAVLAACLLPAEPQLVAAALAHLGKAASSGDIAMLTGCVLTAEQARDLADACVAQHYLSFDSVRLLMLNLARQRLPRAVELSPETDRRDLYVHRSAAHRFRDRACPRYPRGTGRVARAAGRQGCAPRRGCLRQAMAGAGHPAGRRTPRRQRAQTIARMAGALRQRAPGSAGGRVGACARRHSPVARLAGSKAIGGGAGSAGRFPARLVACTALARQAARHGSAIPEDRPARHRPLPGLGRGRARALAGGALAGFRARRAMAPAAQGPDRRQAGATYARRARRPRRCAREGAGG